MCVCVCVVISFGSKSSCYKSSVDAALFQLTAEVLNFLSSQGMIVISSKVMLNKLHIGSRCGLL